jgi:molecular chaperone DnaK (HSP70)
MYLSEILGTYYSSMLLLYPLVLKLEVMYLLEYLTVYYFPKKRRARFSLLLPIITTVTIKVFKGEREMAMDITRIFRPLRYPNSSRGVSQIEITFDTDASDVVHIIVQDKTTKKQMGVTIK